MVFFYKFSNFLRVQSWPEPFLFFIDLLIQAFVTLPLDNVLFVKWCIWLDTQSFAWVISVIFKYTAIFTLHNYVFAFMIAVLMISMKTFLLTISNLLEKIRNYPKCLCLLSPINNTMDNSKIVRVLHLILEMLMYVNTAHETSMSRMCMNPSHEFFIIINSLRELFVPFWSELKRRVSSSLVWDDKVVLDLFVFRAKLAKDITSSFQALVGVVSWGLNENINNALWTYNLSRRLIKILVLLIKVFLSCDGDLDWVDISLGIFWLILNHTVIVFKTKAAQYIELAGQLLANVPLLFSLEDYFENTL